MLGWAGDIQQFLRSKLGTTRDVSLEVSNIGVVDGGNGEGEVVFERMVFTASVNTAGPPYTINMAAAKGGDISVVLAWEEGFIQREEAEELLGSLEGELRGLAGKQES